MLTWEFLVSSSKLDSHADKLYLPWLSVIVLQHRKLLAGAAAVGAVASADKDSTMVTSTQAALVDQLLAAKQQ